MEVDYNVFAESVSASSEEDDDFSTVEDSSDDSDGSSSCAQQQQNMRQLFNGTLDASGAPRNLAQKIYNREVST